MAFHGNWAIAAQEILISKAKLPLATQMPNDKIWCEPRKHELSQCTNGTIQEIVGSSNLIVSGLSWQRRWKKARWPCGHHTSARWPIIRCQSHGTKRGWNEWHVMTWPILAASEFVHLSGARWQNLIAIGRAHVGSVAHDLPPQLPTTSNDFPWLPKDKEPAARNRALAKPRRASLPSSSALQRSPCELEVSRAWSPCVPASLYKLVVFLSGQWKHLSSPKPAKDLGINNVRKHWEGKKAVTKSGHPMTFLEWHRPNADATKNWVAEPCITGKTRPQKKHRTWASCSWARKSKTNCQFHSQIHPIP